MTENSNANVQATGNDTLNKLRSRVYEDYWERTIVDTAAENIGKRTEEGRAAPNKEPGCEECCDPDNTEGCRICGRILTAGRKLTIYEECAARIRAELKELHGHIETLRNLQGVIRMLVTDGDRELDVIRGMLKDIEGELKRYE